jgi:hypothetical protein
MSGNWGGIDMEPFSYSYKWNTNTTALTLYMDETFQSMRTVWHVNLIRFFVAVNWWWIDNESVAQYGGPSVVMSYRNYVQLLVQQAENEGIYVDFCPYAIYDYYDQTPDSGGQPGNLTTYGAAFMNTIATNETQAWELWWTSVVNRLGMYPNVIFEMWNEPDGPTNSNSTAKTNWYTYCIDVYETIRGGGNNNLIFMQWREGAVPGWEEELAWIPDLYGQLKTAIGSTPTNVVFTFHAYRYTWNLQWNTTYAGVLSQLNSTNWIPQTRSSTCDVPVVINECGMGLDLSGTALTNEEDWWDAIIRASQALGVGFVAYYWTQDIGWAPQEGLLSGSWTAGTDSPPASASGQIFLNDYSTAPPTVRVTFTELGLPSGTNWNVTFNGTTSSNSSATITFTVAKNGSYLYSVGNVTGYKASPSTGSVSVYGADVNEQITFTSTVPEFQPFMLLPLFMIITLLEVVASKRKRNARK